MPRHEPTPPPNLSPHEWAPLQEAFIRIIASVESFQLAVHDLYQDLLNGRLKSALRQISSDDKATWRLLKPSDWGQWKVRQDLDLRHPRG